jgi:hypothetical protein
LLEMMRLLLEPGLWNPSVGETWLLRTWCSITDYQEHVELSKMLLRFKPIAFSVYYYAKARTTQCEINNTCLCVSPQHNEDEISWWSKRSIG